MKVLSVLLLLLIAVLVFTQIIYAYGATTVTLRINNWFYQKNTAHAAIGNVGLDNGSFSVWAEVDTPDSESGSFGNQTVWASVHDDGPLSESGSAYCYVNGYDEDGNFQHDDDSDSN